MRRYETGKIGFYQGLEEAYILGVLDEESTVIMQEQAKEIVRLRKALKDIVKCTGTSTLQNKIAREALVEQVSKSDNLDTKK